MIYTKHLLHFSAAPAGVIQKPPVAAATIVKPQSSKPSSAIQKAMEATLASISVPVASDDSPVTTPKAYVMFMKNTIVLYY